MPRSHCTDLAVSMVAIYWMCCDMAWAGAHSFDAVDDSDLRVINTTVIAGQAVRPGQMGCYNHTTMDQAALDTNSTFVFIRVLNERTSILQRNSSPYLTRQFAPEDDESLVFCQYIESPYLEALHENYTQFYSTLPAIYRLNVLYPVALVSALVVDDAPEPLERVQCPFRGSEPVQYRFYMGISDTECHVCMNFGDSISAEQLLACHTARDSDCFEPTDREDTVSIKFGCYGCLMCNASNTVNGTTTTHEHRFRLENPTKSRIAPCAPTDDITTKFLMEPPIVTPSSNVTVGTPRVNITFRYTCRNFTYFNLHHGQEQIIVRPTDVDQIHYELYNNTISYMQCVFSITFSIVKPIVSLGGTYYFEFVTSETNRHFESVTLHITERNCPTGISPPVPCRTDKECIMDWENKPMCNCARGYVGKACQYKCPDQEDYMLTPVNRSIVLPTDCGSVAVLLVCSNATNQSVVWQPKTLLMPKYHSSETWPYIYSRVVRRPIHYTCLDKDTGDVLGHVSVLTANKPVLMPGQQETIHVDNSSQTFVTRIDVDLTKTFGPGPLVYRWRAMSVGELCGWPGEDVCVLKSDPEELHVVHLKHCSGQYQGCVENGYGETCIMVHIIVNSSTCDLNPVLLGPFSQQPAYVANITAGGEHVENASFYFDFVATTGLQLLLRNVNTSIVTVFPTDNTTTMIDSPHCCQRAAMPAGGTYNICWTGETGGVTVEQCFESLVSTPPLVHDSTPVSHLTVQQMVGVGGGVFFAFLLLIITLITVRHRKKNTTTAQTESESLDLVGHLDSDDEIDDAPVSHEIVVPRRKSKGSGQRNGVTSRHRGDSTTLFADGVLPVENRGKQERSVAFSGIADHLAVPECEESRATLISVKETTTNRPVQVASIHHSGVRPRHDGASDKTSYAFHHPPSPGMRITARPGRGCDVEMNGFSCDEQLLKPPAFSPFLPGCSSADDTARNRSVPTMRERASMLGGEEPGGDWLSDQGLRRTDSTTHSTVQHSMQLMQKTDQDNIQQASIIEYVCNVASMPVGVHSVYPAAPEAENESGDEHPVNRDVTQKVDQTEL
ncbi:uncharacterized protein LOC135823983 isoform X2 [Sycon ciliatum]|uniref:uncharacterized protein LOC135823983 isoform X2 n=1 Tax=Sycon ciliatum TaxID=27933 RepID=UPI0031F684B5